MVARSDLTFDLLMEKLMIAELSDLEKVSVLYLGFITLERHLSYDHKSSSINWNFVIALAITPFISYEDVVLATRERRNLSVIESSCHAPTAHDGGFTPLNVNFK